MNDPLLQLQPQWRYCRVKAGEKKPYPANWQLNPLELNQVDSGNIGLLLGPASSGTCAIDFDGTSAWTWFKAQNIDQLPLTPTWTSGKTDRCQMAFRVPSEFWDYLKTEQIKPTKDPLIQAGEGFEFRWTGGQSVLPPSIHPDTGKPYEWLIPPDIPVADIPLDLLELWVKCMDRKTFVVEGPTEIKNIDDLTESDVNEANHLLELLKQKYNQLDYTAWRNVAWAVFKMLGPDAGAILMSQYYPEQQPNEYNNLKHGYNPQRSPGRGTLRHLVGDLLAAEPKTGMDAVRAFRREAKKIRNSF